MRFSIQVYIQKSPEAKPRKAKNTLVAIASSVDEAIPAAHEVLRRAGWGVRAGTGLGAPQRGGEHLAPGTSVRPHT